MGMRLKVSYDEEEMKMMVRRREIKKSYSS